MCVGSLLRESTIFSTTCVPILERNRGNANTATRHLLITRIERGTKYLIQELSHTNVLSVKRVSSESASWSSTRVFIRVRFFYQIPHLALRKLSVPPKQASDYRKKRVTTLPNLHHEHVVLLCRTALREYKRDRLLFWIIIVDCSSYQ
uniref:(northern house mosquito) hypothetical protein n=1 Tax=Culex pipiens TaxID=7175 RepID=A0A8D8NW09_CULPI